MDKQKEYVDKVLDRLVSETSMDYEKVYFPFLINFPIRYLTSVQPRFPNSYFIRHCKDIYGLNDDEAYYVRRLYIKIIRDKIEDNKNTITESEERTVKDSIFLRKMIKYLKDKTKVVIEPFDIYDGYIIAPIGNGFRWDFEYKTIQPRGDFANEWYKEMQGVYGLSRKEVILYDIMGVYMDFIWETIEKISDG